MNFPEHSIVWSMTHACFILNTMVCVSFLEGSARHGRHNSVVGPVAGTFTANAFKRILAYEQPSLGVVWAHFSRL